jgi:hypothetical protein
MRIQQGALHKQLREELIASRERIASMVRPLDGGMINEHPEPNGWSVGQVLEHLYLADALYEEPFKALMRASRQDAGAPARFWKPTLIGGLIAKALINPKPTKGPKAFVPGPTPRPGIVEAFIAREMAFVEAMDAAASYDWRALRIGSPALPSWAPRMNLGDGFRIHTVHVTRHSRQIERLVAMLS